MDNRRAQMRALKGDKKPTTEPLYETVTDLTTGETFLLESPTLFDELFTEENAS